MGLLCATHQHQKHRTDGNTNEPSGQRGVLILTRGSSSEPSGNDSKPIPLSGSGITNEAILVEQKRRPIVSAD